MTKIEKKILLGLYLSNQMVEQEVVYGTYELNWLIQNKLSEAKNWRDPNGGFKSVGGKSDESGNYIAKQAAINSEVKKALSYLKGKNYIAYEKRDLFFFKVRITIDGCEIARELGTKLGYVNLLYKEHKDGIIWFLLTVLTSIFVALVTTLLVNKLKR
ncbi:MAG: hypothetical protein FVQ85_13035 [Planctomycetes bacterium]|nr:hypothetical protein [Planctomycetota bacterium]